MRPDIFSHFEKNLEFYIEDIQIVEPLSIYTARAQGGQLAVHVLALARLSYLRRLLLHHPHCRTKVYEGQATFRHQEHRHRLQLFPDLLQPLDLLQGLPVLAKWEVQLALPARGLLRGRTPYHSSPPFRPSHMLIPYRKI